MIKQVFPFSIQRINKLFRYVVILFLFLIIPASVMASNGKPPAISGIRIEFILFGFTLTGIAIFQKHTLRVAIIGLILVLLIKYIFVPDFSLLQHVIGNSSKDGEWRILLNLMGLLLGFSILAKHFEESKLPEIIPNYLPNDWKGGFVLLLIIMLLASFLDSIASAMIGGTIAFIVFKGRVHLGYLACIVAASNAGGAGSVLGNLPTTMMWIEGVAPLTVFRAFAGAIIAMIICGIFGSIQQDQYQRIQKHATPNVKVDRSRLYIVLLILLGAIAANWTIGLPAVGVWIAIFIGSLIRRTPWDELGKALPGTVFLMALVTCASLMPVDELPTPSWQSAFGLGLVSAVFDNIPLTKLCLDQRGYDWGLLAYSVGFGGSMIWFGSSAGVALSSRFNESKSVLLYVKKGWHVTLAYVVGFFFMLSTLGWNPQVLPKKEKKEVLQTLDVKPKNDTLAKSINP
jgi:Na+/H+ antiporter NhaD/arsenite permease-like protein